MSRTGPKGATVISWAVAAVASLSFTFLAVAWQLSADQSNDNTEQLERLEDQLNLEVDKLEESNRTRRRDVASLEARVAVLEAAP